MLRKAKVGVQFSGTNIGWQVGEDVQDQYKLWESQGLRKQAEAVPPVLKALRSTALIRECP